jgi:nicotinamidase-related amidase
MRSWPRPFSPAERTGQISSKGTAKVVTVDGKHVFVDVEEVLAPDHTALLVIDLQNDFCSVGGICDRMGESIQLMPRMLENAARVIESARRAGALPIFLQNTNYADRRSASPAYIRFHAIQRGYGFEHESTVKGTWGWEFVDRVAPGDDDVVVPKHRSSAFAGTNLDLLLRSNQIRSVVAIGTATHGCVESTARAAEALDYYVVLIEDACAASRKEFHDAAVMVMATRMEVLATDRLCQIWDAAPTHQR